MRKLLVDFAHTLVPPKGDRDGPLPPLMLTLTVVTGLVDAVSFLGLGQVFVANMTGNVALLGFALAGAEGLSAPAPLVSLASFLVGALLLDAGLAVVLGVALALLVVAAVVTRRLAATDAVWVRP